MWPCNRSEKAPADNILKAERLDVRPRRDAPGPGPLGRTGGAVTAGRHGTGRRNGYPIVRLRLPPVPPARVAIPAVASPQGLPRVREGRGARRRPLARREALDVPRQDRGPLRPIDARPGAAVVPHLRQRERGAAEVGMDIPEGPLGLHDHAAAGDGRRVLPRWADPRRPGLGGTRAALPEAPAVRPAISATPRRRGAAVRAMGTRGPARIATPLRAWRRRFWWPEGQQYRPLQEQARRYSCRQVSLG